MDHTLTFIREPGRDIPVVADVDVLVAGGGPAGIAAALSSARSGARTVLVERYGYLGGMITGAHVTHILGVGDGEKPLAQGITREIRDRLERLSAISPVLDCGDYAVDAEVFKWQAAEMLLEAGADIRLHTLACAPVLEDGRVAGAFFEGKSGREAVRAQVTIDATADADLAFRAGCACDDQTHEVTLRVVVEGVDQEEVDAFARESPREYERIVEDCKRRSGGELPGHNRLMRGIDVADAVDLTRAEIVSRREYFEGLMFLRDAMPGYGNARITSTGAQIGVRQGRRVRGEYVVADDDLKSSRHFEDGVARLGVYFPGWGPLYRLSGVNYDIPYRCLVPEKIDGLLVSGRCVSSDYIACNSLRLIVPCFCTVQAAGCAAAIAAQGGFAPRRVPITELREGLVAQDVYLG